MSSERELLRKSRSKKLINDRNRNNYNKFLDSLAEQLTNENETMLSLETEEFENILRDEFEKYASGKLKNMKSVITETTDVTKRKKLQDAYDNSALLIGDSDTFGQYDTYSMNGMLYNWTLWNALYMSSWVFAKVINRISSDMIRNGWDINIEMKSTAEIVKTDDKRIYKRDTTDDFDHKRFKSLQRAKINDIIEAIKWMRLFGGSAIFLLDSSIKDESEYEKPLEKIDTDRVKFLVGDRWTGLQISAEMVEDEGSPDYNTPKYYTYTADAGQSIRFHHTRVARFSNGKAPAIIQRMLMGWGIPEGVRIFNEINKDEKIKGMITSLLSKYNLEIIKTDGMRAYMNGNLSAEMESQLDGKLELINRYRSFNSLVFLDSADDYTRLDGGGLAGLYDIFNSQARYVAGASDLPQVLLYGDQQSGLSGNTFDDLMLYEDTLESKRNETLLDPINKITEWFLMMMKTDYNNFEIMFNKSIPVTEEDKVDKTRSMIEAWKDLVDMGIYDPYMVAKEMRETKDLLVGKEIDKAVLDRLYEEYYNRDGLIDEDEEEESVGSSEPRVPSDALFNPDDTEEGVNVSEEGIAVEDLTGE